MTVLNMSLDDFERMVDLVRRDDASLANLPLEPFGRYQNRSITLDALTREVAECVADGLKRRGSAEFPTLYYAWGKARVGSTPLTNLFGVAGLPSYYQPVKAVMRHRLNSEPGVFFVPPAAEQHPHLFAKETAGPYMTAECLMIPLQALIEAGYPADKLHLIVLDREPSSSLASWIKQFSHRVPEALLVRNNVLAALNIRRVENYARRAGVPMTHYVYEASKEPVPSARALFNRIGLADRFTAEAVTEWKEMGQLESEHSKVIYPEESEVYDLPGVHGSDTAYKYRIGGAASLSAANIAFLARFGIPDVHRASARACASDLGFDAETSARLFGIDGRHSDRTPARELEPV